ncbi:hypothetical protein F8M41_016733 [Gigaspora margarita]|uniref:Uncharacterized protein n=1 Tax=Gigaspora margarita TaxID=4874 RepID=A0A8H4AP46_GIGMA|nr:hypothetical protein F8M41_016733 [Gigaspora margarita]
MNSDDKIKEFGKIKVSKFDDESDKKVTLEWDIRPTITEVLDTYYDLDNTIEEPMIIVKRDESEEVGVKRGGCVEKEKASDYCPKSVDMELAEGTIDVGDHYRRKFEPYKEKRKTSECTKKPKEGTKATYLMIE